MANKVTKAPAKPAALIKAEQGKVSSPKAKILTDISSTANKVSNAKSVPSFKLIPAVVSEPRFME